MSEETPKPLGISVGEGIKAQERIGPPPPPEPKKHKWIPLVLFCDYCNQRTDENPSEECPGK